MKPSDTLKDFESECRLCPIKNPRGVGFSVWKSAHRRRGAKTTYAEYVSFEFEANKIAFAKDAENEGKS